MRPRQQFTDHQRAEVQQAQKLAVSKEEFQRVQAVLLRMELGLRAADIGKILGLNKASIWRIHSRYFKEGAVIFKGIAHGGRYRENLSNSQEQKLLKPFLEKAEKMAC